MNDRIKLTARYTIDKKFMQEESYLLDCVRMGRRGDIEAVLFSEKYLEEMEHIFGNDISFVRMVFSYLWPKVVYVAVEGGLPETVSWEYGKYYDNLQRSQSVRALLEMNRRLFIEFADKVALTGADAHLSPLVRKVNRYITNHIYEKLTISYIAQKFHFSRSYLSHVYKHETGETITGRIQYSKSLEAKRLLQYSPLSLTDIGFELGFCSQSHFSDVFRKETGMTPHCYRRLYQKNSEEV